MPAILIRVATWLGLGAVFGAGSAAGGTVANAVKPDWTKIGIVAIIAIVVIKKL